MSNEKILDLYYGQQDNIPAVTDLEDGLLYFTDKGRLYDGNSKKLIGEDLDKLNIGKDNIDIDGTSIIHGDENITGVKGFYIEAISEISNRPFAVKIGLTQPTKKPRGWSADDHVDFTVSDYFAAGDKVNICFGKKWWDFTVDHIDADEYGYVHFYAPEEFLSYIFSFEGYKDGEVPAKDEFSIYNKEYPERGLISLKEHTNAYGYQNWAQGNYSSAFGLRNKAYGDYSFVQGRDRKSVV